jgi:hypothetical protein
MNSKEMESKYAGLRQAKDTGRISDAQYREEVARLRLQASDGSWYQINPDDGRWMRWNGTAWEKSPPAAAQPSGQPQAVNARPPVRPQGQKQASAQNASAQTRIPTKFFPLLGYIAKSTVKVFRQQFKSMVFFGVLGWLLHTYLLVFVNQGFGQDTWVGQILSTQGNSLIGTIIWMIGSGLLFSWLGRKMFGPKGYKPPKAPSYSEMFREAGEMALAAMAATAGISMVIGIFGIGWGNAAMAIGIGGTMLTAGSSVIGLLVSSAWSSTYGLQQSVKAAKFSITTGKVAMAGSIGAFLLGALLGQMWQVKLIFGLVFLGLAFYLTHRENKSMIAMFIAMLPALAMAGMVYLIGHAHPVFADDGGWQEAGGNFGSWVKSEGAIQAIGSGVLPGIGVAIGPALYQVLISMGYNIDINGLGVQPPPDIGPVTGPVQIPQSDIPLKDEHGNTLLTWNPEQYGPGDDGKDGKPGWVWYNGNWVDPATAKSQIDKINPEANIPQQPNVNMTDEDGKPVITWQPGKYGPDTEGKPGGPGMVWHWGSWVTPQQAQQEVNQDLTRQAKDQADQERNLAEWRAKNAEALSKEREQAAAEVAAANAKRAQEAAQAAWQQNMANHIVDKMGNDPNVGADVRDAANRGDFEALKDYYKDKLTSDMQQSQSDAQHYNNMATLYGAGEMGAKLVVAGSKGALIAIGGPAGMVVTGTMVGTITAAQEGTTAYVNGDSTGQIIEKTGVGFLSGFKDGAVGIYTQTPGISTGAKYLIPAAADAGQTFIQSEISNPGDLTGNLTKALGSGGMSIGSTYIGNKIDSSNMGNVGKEIGNVITGTVGGAVGNAIQGGDPGEGAVDGFINSVGGRVGGHMGTAALDSARTQSEAPVKQAIGEGKAQREQEVGIGGQSKQVQELAGTVKQGDDGKNYVDEGGALNQLRDTQSSRTAKQAPDEIKEAISNTRTEKIYKPADEATINGVRSDLESKGIIKPGEELVMDTFSTPGKETPVASVGADRDARLVVMRPDPDNPGQMQKIEIPREHWEDKAYKDFYDHTTKMAGGEQNITEDKYPGYFKRVDEMTKNNPQGFSEDQIKSRAWAEEHNQLFTDKNHVESSRDNSDQLTKFVNGQETQTQGKSNVELTQKGESRLLDPEGYAKMWHEKSEVYAHMGNQPEAIAQSQKGVAEYMKIREGYDKQGFNVPPVDNQTAKAMEIISKAPVGVDATPQAIAKVNEQLQNLGFKDTNDALGKVAMQNEALKFSQPKGISSANTIRMGVNGIQPPPPEQPSENAVY